MSEISKDIANFSRDPQESTEKSLQEQMLIALGSLVFKSYGAIVWRGEFNLGTLYQVNDFVSFENSLYICTQENAGELLIEGFWDVMISSPSEVELRVFENNIEWKLESSIVWNHLMAIPSKFNDLEDDATHTYVFNTSLIEDIDGIRKSFTVADNYIDNSTRLYLNGQRLKLVDDYAESGIAEITFVEAPQLGDKIIIDYLKNI